MSKSVESALMAAAAGIIAGTGLWLGGVDALIWPVHPFWAQLVLTLAATLFTRIVWMRHLEAREQYGTSST